MGEGWAGFWGLSYPPTHSRSCPPSTHMCTWAHKHTHTHPPQAQRGIKGPGPTLVHWAIGQKAERLRKPLLFLEASTCHQHLPSVAGISSLQGSPSQSPGLAHTPPSHTPQVTSGHPDLPHPGDNCSWLPRLIVPPKARRLCFECLILGDPRGHRLPCPSAPQRAPLSVS